MISGKYLAMLGNLESIILGEYGEPLFPNENLKSFFGIPAYHGNIPGSVAGYVADAFGNDYREIPVGRNLYRWVLYPKFVVIREDIVRKARNGDPYAWSVLYHEKGHILYNNLLVELKGYGVYYAELAAGAYAIYRLWREGKLRSFLKEIRNNIYGGEHWMINAVLGYARANGGRYLKRLMDLVSQGVITAEDAMVYITMNADSFRILKRDVDTVLSYYRRLGFRITKRRRGNKIVYILNPTEEVMGRYHKVHAILNRYLAS